MKKYFVIAFLMLLCGVVTGQVVDSLVVAPIVVPAEPITFDFTAWVATLTSVASAAVFLGAFVIKLFKVTVSIWKQVIVWGVAIVLTFLGNLLNIGFAANFPWLTTAVYGLAAGLVANGIFDIKTVQTLLDFLKLKEVKK